MSSSEKDLRPEYPPELVRSGTRGKYAQRYREEGTNIALIDPDLHELFPDSAAVNRALRDYVEKRRRSTT
jgi:hypothetical protein